MLTRKDEKRRILCRDDIQKRLWKAGIKELGYESVLENIITEWGFNLPGWEDIDGTIYYGFMETINGKIYKSMYLTYVDALAEEILFILENEL